MVEYGNSMISGIFHSGVVTTFNTNSALVQPSGVTFDLNRSVIVAEYFDYCIGFVSPTGVNVTLTGLATRGFPTRVFRCGVGTQARFNSSSRIATDEFRRAFHAVQAPSQQQTAPRVQNVRQVVSPLPTVPSSRNALPVSSPHQVPSSISTSNNLSCSTTGAANTFSGLFTPVYSPCPTG